jgi:class 3 adenylate cyclase
MSLKAFLIADIRGYTTYTQQRGDEAGARLTTRFYEILRERVEAEGGDVIETRGDEVLAVFDSPRSAIKAAVDIQARLLEATLADPEMPLGAGIGLDVGEAVEVEGGFRGGALNLAARLCSQARPGEIYATQELVHLARALEGIEYLARSAVRLKGMEKPVQPVKVAAEVDPASLWAAMPGRASSPPRKTVSRTPLLIGGALALVAAVVLAVVLMGGKDDEQTAAPDNSPSAGPSSPAAAAGSAPTVGDCPVFPADNPWNRRVDDLPAAQNSDRLIASIGADEPLHPDFGPRYKGDEVGLVITYVDGEVPMVPVDFKIPEESDVGPYALPPETKIEDSSDRHVIVVDRSSCTLYELLNARPSGGRWTAYSGAIFDLTSNDLRPIGWMSADTAGLPIFPGLARYDEVAAGEINHALRFTADETRAAFIYPARREAGVSDDPDLPPMGLRVRLKADFPVDDYPPQAQVILRALQTYGMMLASNGSNWFISGEANELWSQADLDALKRLQGSDFEVVDTSSFESP